MSVKANIGNLALSFLKARQRVNNFETDTGLHADLLRLLYPDAVELALSDYNHSFATKTRELAQVAINDDDLPDGFAYAYALPTDYVRPICGLGGIDHFMSVHNNQRVIFTSATSIELTYVYDISESPELFPVNFKMAVAYFLAALMSPSINGTKGRESRQLETDLYAKANAWLTGSKKLDGVERGYREHESVWLEN